MDALKAFIILLGYLALAPALGWVLSRSRTYERVALCLLVFMPSWQPSMLTLMLDSIETYRGHTKGFEASLIEVLALALAISAKRRSRERDFKWLPPGGGIYLAYCIASSLSLFAASNTVYGLMAVAKFSMAVIVFIGAFHAFRDETDLRWVFRALAFALVLQGLVALKLRYIDGRFQTHGWFEHQNPMAMWAYLCALPMFSLSLDPLTSRRDTQICLVGVGAAAMLVLLSVSRAALAAFVVGAGGVIFLAACRGFTPKLIRILLLSIVVAVMAGLLALNSLRVRLEGIETGSAEQDLRDVLIVQSKAMLHDHPFGVGWNNYGLANSLPDGPYAQIMMDWDEGRGFHIYEEKYYANPLPESLYWLMFAETGYAGPFLYMTFLLVSLWWALRGLIAYWKTPVGYLVAGLLVALTLTYIHGMVERVLTQTKNMSMWLMMAGFLARIDWLRRKGAALAKEVA